jgi:hypothetical protein
MFTSEWHNNVNIVKSISSLSLIDNLNETLLVNQSDQDLLDYLAEEEKEKNLKRSLSTSSFCSQRIKKNR